MAGRGSEPQFRRLPRVAATFATPWATLRKQLGQRNRVMLFWEAQLEGDVATRYRDVETLDRQVHGKAAQVPRYSKLCTRHYSPQVFV